MDIQRITEVGIACRDLEVTTRLFVDVLGAEAGPVHEVERYAMRYRMCRLGKVDFELMEPTGDDGVIAKFIRRRGEGLHHVAFAVDDLEDGMARLRQKGVQFVDELPVTLRLEGEDFAGRAFAGELRIAFSHPGTMLGTLFEFIQYPAGYDPG